jgi:YidC/Oxa1 family membrane protein insertase
MEKNRTLIAVVLSIVIIMGFQHWMAARYPKHGQLSPAQPSAQAPAATAPIEVAPTAPISAEQAQPLIQEEDEYVAESDRHMITFSNLGGAIKRIELKEFADKETGEPYLLMDAKDPQYYAGSIDLLGRMADRSAIYALTKDGKQITYKHTSDGIEITKTYKMRNAADYIELFVEYRNTSAAGIKTSSGIAIGSGMNIENMMSQRYHYVSAKIDGVITWLKKSAIKPGSVAWLTLNNEYFCLLLKPYQLAEKTSATLIEKNNISGAIESAEFIIPSGSAYTHQYLLYVGPFDAGRLKALDLGLEEAVNYGKLNGIVKVLVKTLSLFQKVVKNWGLAIIFLTALVNLVLFPLTKKSYKSMRAAQELQPQIEKLRSAHKDNPQKAQKEIMELYRQYKVNPMSGCLPMFLQFPIFFALYHVLMRSVVLKGANFLWINDLSKPDALGIPFTLPYLGDSINILPIVTSAVMFVQQKVMSAKKTDNTSEQMKQQQAMMAVMIPGMMLVFFYNMPSGFVLYFLVNSAVMAYVQYMIKKS